HETEEKEPEVANVEKEPEHETQDTEPIPIIVFRPTTKPTLEAETEIIGSSSRPQLTDLIVEDPKALVVIPYEINEVLHHLTNKQIQAHIDKEEKFGDFGVTEWDELGPIIPKKKNKVVGELMTSLGKKYDRLKVISIELGIHPTLSAPKQVPSLSSGRKRKTQELEPEVRIPGLECNRSLPKGVQFVNN
ncbi:hypothetical protein Tco_0455128, partial [Tanacetum coccineum]